jgi:hypothetical protein
MTTYATFAKNAIGVIYDKLAEMNKKLDDAPTRSEHNAVKLRITALEDDGKSYGSKYLTRRDGAVATGVITFLMSSVVLLVNLFGGK